MTKKVTIFEPNAPIWCRDVDGTVFSFDQFLERITAFHGYPAPGLVIGGKMVAVALEALASQTLFDAIVETGNCLPDAIQMLTPCTVGNGWLKVLELGRFALALYDKRTGRGVRVFVHPKKIAAWPQIDLWFFKRQPKDQQDAKLLLAEIQRAGEHIMQMQSIQVHARAMTRIAVGARGLCPECAESYPLKHGPLCRACQGDSPYATNPFNTMIEVQPDKGA